jgi:RES domain
MELEARRPDGQVFRLGRRPDAWQPPDWLLAQSDGTFGNRFDDPEGYYRVLYASSQRLACFVETLARFRPDLSLLAELGEIVGTDDFLPLGTLPRDWLAARMMGTANIDGIFADIYAVTWVSHLRNSLAAEALRLGVKDIDLSTLENAEPRRLTQLASRQAYRLNFAGIFYHSRYGHSLENWAIFEPFPLENVTSEVLSEDDPELQEALRIHGLHLV